MFSGNTIFSFKLYGSTICYLQAVLEHTGKLLPLHLVVVYPGLNGSRWILRAWNAIWNVKQERQVGYQKRYVEFLFCLMKRNRWKYFHANQVII